MQVPKNVVQVGTVSGERKWYMEDYVHTFIRQQKKTQNIFHLYGALEGNHRFVYGAVLEEAEWRKYAREHFSAWQEIGKLRVHEDDWKVQEGGGWVALRGYFIFYEKNEAMQSYMIDCKAMEEGEKELEKEPTMERIAAKRRKENGWEPKREEESGQQEEESKESGGKNWASGGPIEWGNPQQSRRRKKSFSVPAAGTIRNIRKIRQMPKPASGAAVSEKAALPKIAVAAALLILCAAGIGGINRYQEMKEAGEVFGDAYQSVSETDKPRLIVEEKGEKAEKAEIKTADSKAAGIETAEIETALLEEGAVPEDVQAAEQSEAMQKADAQPAEQPEGEAAQEGEAEQTGGEAAQADSAGTGDSGQAGMQQPDEALQQMTAQEDAGSGQADESGSEDSDSFGAGAAEADSEAAEEEDAALANATASAEYYVEKGDSLAGISRKFYGTTARVKDICRLNDISNPDLIEQGQKLLLP